MDHASMLAVLSFQLEEVNLFLALPELPTSDCIRQAVIVQKQELVRQIVSLRDHALCLSIGEAVQTDAAAIPLTQAAEIEHGLRDASLEAINISESEVPRASSDTPPEETVREPCDQTHDTVDELDNVPKECVACNEHKFADEVHSLPCNHDYCFDCIEHLFIDALADDSLFPPRCCGHEYPLADIRPALPPILVQEIELKLIEKATGDRTYCCNAQCSVFIPPQPTSTTTAVCTRCATSTCISCRREAHPNQPCYEVSDDAVLQLATEQGWKRCFHCRNMIELRTGCNHITCRCGTQFCYVCTRRWRTCTCPQWHERNLLERATVFVDRNRAQQAGEDAAPAAPGTAAEEETARQREIEDAVRVLRVEHNCNHRGRWARVEGRHQCEACDAWLYNYIWRCGQCHVHHCARCRD